MIEIINRLFRMNEPSDYDISSEEYYDIFNDLEYYASIIQKWYRKIIAKRRNLNLEKKNIAMIMSKKRNKRKKK